MSSTGIQMPGPPPASPDMTGLPSLRSPVQRAEWEMQMADLTTRLAAAKAEIEQTDQHLADLDEPLTPSEQAELSGLEHEHGLVEGMQAADRQTRRAELQGRVDHHRQTVTSLSLKADGLRGTQVTLTARLEEAKASLAQAAAIEAQHEQRRVDHAKEAVAWGTETYADREALKRAGIATSSISRKDR